MNAKRVCRVLMVPAPPRPLPGGVGKFTLDVDVYIERGGIYAGVAVGVAASGVALIAGGQSG